MNQLFSIGSFRVIYVVLQIYVIKTHECTLTKQICKYASMHHTHIHKYFDAIFRYSNNLKSDVDPDILI